MPPVPSRCATMGNARISRSTVSEGAADSALVKALWHLLRPLVRLLVRHGITFPRLTPMLKTLYLEAAEDELGSDATGSRIHLATGLHRKDVRRLRNEAGDHLPPGPLALGARVVAKWIGEAETTDGRGEALALPLRSESGPSLEALIASVSTDVRPRAVYEEWLRLGVIELDDLGLARLREAAFVPSRGFEEKAHYFGRNLHNHIASSARNLAGDEPPLLERSVYYNQLSQRSVDELAILTKELGQGALETVNRRALELQRRDREAGERDRRIHFGVYFFEAAEGEGADDA